MWALLLSQRQVPQRDRARRAPREGWFHQRLSHAEGSRCGGSVPRVAAASVSPCRHCALRLLHTPRLGSPSLISGACVEPALGAEPRELLPLGAPRCPWHGRGVLGSAAAASAALLRLCACRCPPRPFLCPCPRDTWPSNQTCPRAHRNVPT